MIASETCTSPQPACRDTRCRWHLGDALSLHETDPTREVWIELDQLLPTAVLFPGGSRRRPVPEVLRRLARRAAGEPRELEKVVKRCSATCSERRIRALLHRLRDLGVARVVGWDPYGCRMCALHEIRRHPDGMTLDEIGDLLGVTRERARQIELMALIKVREAHGVDELRPDDG